MKHTVLLAILLKVIEKLCEETNKHTRIPRKSKSEWGKTCTEFVKKIMNGHVMGVTFKDDKNLSFLTKDSLRGFKNFVQEFTKVIETKCEWTHLGECVRRGHAKGSTFMRITTDDEELTAQCTLQKMDLTPRAFKRKESQDEG